ncbi:MAG: hypothetical protein KAG66_06485, partial [Methylococcales bacterium]|nr:hypothetical protein [Methylococcales bacterium]
MPGGKDNFNLLLFEDKKGSELVHIQAEKNNLLHVKNDSDNKIDHNEKNTIGHNRTEKVGHDEKISIGHNRKVTVKKHENIRIKANQSLKVSKNQHERVSMFKTETIGLGKALTVGLGYQVTVGLGKNVTVGMSSSEQVGLYKNTLVGKSYSLNAVESIKTDTKEHTLSVSEKVTIKSNKATIVLDDKGIMMQGDIKIKGDVEIKGNLSVITPVKPEACKNCPTTGNPVNPIRGFKVLSEDPDLVIDAALPLEFSRSYASDVAYEGLLGQGWGLDFLYRIEIHPKEIHLYNSFGKKDIFPRLKEGQSHLIPKGRVKLAHLENDKGYRYSLGARQYHFATSEASQGVFRLTRISDVNDNSIGFHYEDKSSFPSWIALDNRRLFRLLGNEGRLLGLEELRYESDLGTAVLKSEQGLFVINHSKENTRLRVSSIESLDSAQEEKLKESYRLQSLPEATLVPLLRYAYSEEGDLIAVYGKNDLLKRTFQYK